MASRFNCLERTTVKGAKSGPFGVHCAFKETATNLRPRGQLAVVETVCDDLLSF